MLCTGIWNSWLLVDVYDVVDAVDYTDVVDVFDVVNYADVVDVFGVVDVLDYADVVDVADVVFQRWTAWLSWTLLSVGKCVFLCNSWTGGDTLVSCTWKIVQKGGRVGAVKPMLKIQMNSWAGRGSLALFFVIIIIWVEATDDHH